MIKTEKVIKGLECCSDALSKCGKNYPYWDIENCQSSMQADTLALLKAQELIAPVKVNRYMETDENGDWFSPETYDCGNCDVELHGKANYCYLCGQAVKWE